MNVLRLLKSITGSDVHLTYLKSGTHQLHEPENIEVLNDALLKLLEHPVFTSNSN